MFSNHPRELRCQLACVNHQSWERTEEGKVPLTEKCGYLSIRKEKPAKEESSQRNRLKIRKIWCLRGQERRPDDQDQMIS